MAISTLYDYYTSKGQALPSLSARAQLYQQLGLGSASSYAGTAGQNNALLSKLQSPTPTSSQLSSLEQQLQQAQQALNQVTKTASTTTTPSTTQNQTGNPSFQAYIQAQFGKDSSTLTPDQIGKAQENYRKLYPGSPIPDVPAENGQTVKGDEQPTTTSPTTDSVQSALSAYFTPDQLKSMPDTLKSFFGMLGAAANQKASVTTTNIDQTIKDAQMMAQSDPLIAMKYAEDFKFAQQQVANVLPAYQQQLSQLEAEQKIDFPTQQRQLSEQEAAAGQAYSGFRQQAEQRLKLQQSGVINSTASQYKQAIQSLGSGFEQKYGTAKLPTNLDLNYQGQNIGYTPVGNVLGTSAAAQASDISSLAQQKVRGLITPTL